VLGQQVRQALQAAGAGLAADAGIHHRARRRGFFQALRKQRDPTGFGRYVIRGGQRIAEHQDRALGRRRGRPSGQ